ncbi:hypothetical protein [Winogradskyella sp.]|uniref:hypothetical protein n=1 Tax=Winogradskyella sp. TaxID=1883156 RepID=UPI00262D3666|nr:hypothetical protein [Winogradskyella sp.]
MNEKKNIDRLFQEKFKDFEVAPNDAVWNRISESLPKKKKKRRVVALWWQIGGVAALIALLLTVGVSVFKSNEDNAMPVIVDTENQNINSEGTQSNTDIQDPKNNLNTKTGIKVTDSNESKASSVEDINNNSLEQHTSNELISTHTSKSNSLVNNNTDKKDNKASSLENNNLTKIADQDSRSKIVSTDERVDDKDKNKPIDPKELKSIITETVKNKNSAVTDNTTSTKSEASSTENKNAQANAELLKEKETTILKEDANKVSIIDAIADNNKDTDEKEKEEDEQNRWSIVPNVAPVYFNSLGEGSSIDSQFNNNSKSGDINMSYGISGAYAISKKLKVRAGINRVNLSQTTSGVLAFNGGEFASRGGDEVPTGNINPKAGIGNITLMSANMFDRNTTPEIFNTKTTGNIDQRFGFIEVPLELEYRLLDKKFGVNVIGGFSTFFLSENEIYADIDGTSTLIGEANNINSTSFSANFGLGLDYSLSKHWNINLEPQFKYQINTFNNTFGNFRPFFIGVYTGLSFKF